MIGARAKEMYEKQAKDRQREATVKGNKTRHGKDMPVKENLPELANGQSRDHAGKAVSVSGKMIDLAHFFPFGFLLAGFFSDSFVASSHSENTSTETPSARASLTTADQLGSALRWPCS